VKLDSNQNSGDAVQTEALEPLILALKDIKSALFRYDENRTDEQKEALLRQVTEKILSVLKSPFLEGVELNDLEMAALKKGQLIDATRQKIIQFANAFLMERHRMALSPDEKESQRTTIADEAVISSLKRNAMEMMLVQVKVLEVYEDIPSGNRCLDEEGREWRDKIIAKIIELICSGNKKIAKRFGTETEASRKTVLSALRKGEFPQGLLQEFKYLLRDGIRGLQD
jgi:hypothetical protein